MSGLAGDGAEVPLAVACGEEGDCPVLECGGCMEALLSCPKVSVSTATCFNGRRSDKENNAFPLKNR